MPEQTPITKQTPYQCFLNTIVQGWRNTNKTFTMYRDNSSVIVYREGVGARKYHAPDAHYKKGQTAGLGYHLCALVNADVNRLDLAKLEKKKPKQIITHWFNHEAIKANIAEYIYEIDIMACYWDTAYFLKFISKETFLKGLEKYTYKEGCNVALGAIANTIMVQKYKDGMLIDTHYERKPTTIVRELIIDHVFKMALRFYKKYKDDILWFETDCFFITGRIYQEICADLRLNKLEPDTPAKRQPILLRDSLSNKKGDIIIRTEKAEYRYPADRNIKEIINSL